MKLTRRAMIKDGMLAVSAGMVMPAILSRGIASANTLAAGGTHVSQAASDRTLIVVQMAGGNDGLNTVIPLPIHYINRCAPLLPFPMQRCCSLMDGLVCIPILHL